MVKLSSANDSDITTPNRQVYKNRHEGANAKSVHLSHLMNNLNSFLVVIYLCAIVSLKHQNQVKFLKIKQARKIKNQKTRTD